MGTENTDNQVHSHHPRINQVANLLQDLLETQDTDLQILDTVLTTKSRLGNETNRVLRVATVHQGHQVNLDITVNLTALPE